MIKTLAAIISLTFALCAAAQNAPHTNPTQSPSKAIDPSLLDLPAGTAEATIKFYKLQLSNYRPDETITPKMKEEKGGKAQQADLTSTDILVMSGKMKMIALSLNAEEDSKCARKWFASLQKLLMTLSMEKQSMEGAVQNGDETLYAQSLVYYKKTLLEYLETSANPVKLDKDQLAEIKAKNRKIRQKIMEEQSSTATKN
jgi:hypothetical protein